jgi:DNA-binding MarR family transcriptional regulator
VGMRTADPGRSRDALDADLAAVLVGVEDGRSAGEIAAATGLSPGEARGALARLEAAGLIVRSGLGAYERTAQ